MTCNDCGRDISYCDRHGCREVNGTAWDEWARQFAKKPESKPTENDTAGEQKNGL